MNKFGSHLTEYFVFPAPNSFMGCLDDFTYSWDNHATDEDKEGDGGRVGVGKNKS